MPLPMQQKGFRQSRQGRKQEKVAGGLYLFTTKTCPNCKAAKEFLKDVDYQIIDAEENEEMSDKYGIMTLPCKLWQRRPGNQVRKRAPISANLQRNRKSD